MKSKGREEGIQTREKHRHAVVIFITPLVGEVLFIFLLERDTHCTEEDK